MAGLQRASDWFGRLRLRYKLGLILSLAALLPVAVVSTVAMWLVISGLESGVQQQTDRTLRVGLNLVLAHFKDGFESGARLAESGDLAAALIDRKAPAGAIEEVLSRVEEQLPEGLVEVANADGHVVARRAVGGVQHPEDLELADGDPPIARALAYERRVTIEHRSDRLVVRAVAPVVNDAFRLCGAVVLTAPLGPEFADRLKAQLSIDVVLYAGEQPIASSFIAADGHRELGFAAPESVLAAVRHGQTAVADAAAFGKALSVGCAPLINFDGGRVGMICVARDESTLAAARAQAWRSLSLGAASAFAFALLLAALLSRRLTGPLAHLHASARAVARGDLETQPIRETGDEIGDLAEAFAQMTRAVRENQERLAARMREITTLHEIGRAISSVLGLDGVLRKIVDVLAAVLTARRSVLLLADEEGALRVGAGVGVDEEEAMARLGDAVAWRGGPLLVDDVGAEEDLAGPAAEAGMVGSLLAVPLEQKDHFLGLLLVNREFARFGDTDLRLVATFADQAAVAIQNARLYDEVHASSEELERKVNERTGELVEANQELQNALSELGQAQAQLVLSERMAGLGALVAGIAHEINSPAGAIQGAVDTLGDNVSRLAKRARELHEIGLSTEDRARFFALVEQLAPRLATAQLASPVAVRRQARELTERLAELGVAGAGEACRTLVEIGAGEAAYQLAAMGANYGLAPLVGYLEQYAYLHRNIHAVRTAIRRITRIVGALKGYSHLDQAKVTTTDLHEGIENTLIILHHELKYGISIGRKYAALPPVPVFVDELNQVWTNLIHNAVQALGGKGHIVIETSVDGDHVAVTVEDSGPGISPEVMPLIFAPFFTTKVKGEGTGLGLGIVKQIVEKHGGQIEVTSRPGLTRFTVRLPIAGPPSRFAGDDPALGLA